MSAGGGSVAAMWLAPMTALAIVGLIAAAILLRDHVRLERKASALEGTLEALKRELRQLAERSERDRAIVAAQRDLVVLRDADGFVTFTNNAFRQFTEERRIGVKVAARPPRPCGGDAVMIEEKYRTRDGECRVAWIETPIAVGGREGTLRVGREITDEADREHTTETFAGAMADTVAHPPEAGAPAGPKRVLVVEDNDVNALLALKSLERVKALVDWARDGFEAVAMVEESFSGSRQGYDLVLMDLRMPGLDGLEATRRIRRLEATLARPEPVRIAALTATTMRQDRLAAQAAGINEFLAKPYSAESLGNLLEATPGRQLEAS
jgi:CheY-like chemotaxis protein